MINVSMADTAHIRFHVICIISVLTFHSTKLLVYFCASVQINDDIFKLDDFRRGNIAHCEKYILLVPLINPTRFDLPY